MSLGKTLSRLGEIRCSNKNAFICFSSPETATESSYLGLANGVLTRIALGLNVNSIEPQSVLIDDSVDSAIARSTNNCSSLLPRTAIAHREEQCDDKSFKKRRRRCKNSIKKFLSERRLDLQYGGS